MRTFNTAQSMIDACNAHIVGKHVGSGSSYNIFKAQLEYMSFDEVFRNEPLTVRQAYMVICDMLGRAGLGAYFESLDRDTQNRYFRDLVGVLNTAAEAAKA